MLNDVKREIKISIFQAIDNRGFTYEQCCKSFNKSHKYDIENHGLKRLNKDLLYRIKTESFSPANIRVVKLCEFLHIDTNEMRKTPKISREALKIDELVKMKPYLQSEVAAFIENLIALTNKKEEIENEIH